MGRAVILALVACIIVISAGVSAEDRPLESPLFVLQGLAGHFYTYKGAWIPATRSTLTNGDIVAFVGGVVSKKTDGITLTVSPYAAPVLLFEYGGLNKYVVRGEMINFPGERWEFAMLLSVNGRRNGVCTNTVSALKYLEAQNALVDIQCITTSEPIGLEYLEILRAHKNIRYMDGGNGVDLFPILCNGTGLEWLSESLEIGLVNDKYIKCANNIKRGIKYARIDKSVIDKITEYSSVLRGAHYVELDIRGVSGVSKEVYDVLSSSFAMYIVFAEEDESVMMEAVSNIGKQCPQLKSIGIEYRARVPSSSLSIGRSFGLDMTGYPQLDVVSLVASRDYYVATGLEGHNTLYRFIGGKAPSMTCLVLDDSFFELNCISDSRLKGMIIAGGFVEGVTYGVLPDCVEIEEMYSDCSREFEILGNARVDVLSISSLSDRVPAMWNGSIGTLVVSGETYGLEKIVSRVVNEVQVRFNVGIGGLSQENYKRNAIPVVSTGCRSAIFGSIPYWENFVSPNYHVALRYPILNGHRRRGAPVLMYDVELTRSTTPRANR